MRTLAPCLIALTFATPLWADDFYTQAPVVAATVYPQGAELTRRATLDLPAGSHRVFLPARSRYEIEGLPRIRTSPGVEIGTMGFNRGIAVNPEDLFTGAQRAAFEKVKLLEQQVQEQKDRIGAARLGIEAIEAQRAFLSAIRPPAEGQATLEELTALAGMVRAETEAALVGITQGQAALRPLVEALEDLETELTGAVAAFERLSPPGGKSDMMDMIALEVTLAEPISANFELTELTRDAVWRLDYDLFLTRGDAPALEIRRNLIVVQRTGEIWSDIALTLSTARPGESIAPEQVWPNKAEIYEPRVYAMEESRAMAGAAPPPMAEPTIMLEDAGPTTAELRVDGLAISYAYPGAVTIASADGAELALDALAFAAQTEIHASPRHDNTAFLMATLRNDRAEPVLPGEASFYRDGHFVGRQHIAMVPAGAETTLPFGPIEGLRLKTVFQRNQTGDTGILTRSNTRDQQISFTIENLTGEAQTVRAFYPLPFSEQEDLEVSLNVRPRPDETDIDDKRGVSAWDLTLAPGASETVQIGVSLNWPEGQELNWYP